jgi:hypothetical protein
VTSESKARDAAKAAARAEQHPGRPEQFVEGFETGYDQARDTPEELLGPNFARGNAAEDAPGPQRQGRFSEGAEQQGETPEKVVEGRFNESIEQKPPEG